jgi:ribose-phosphate pyrophosphokinase
MSDLMSDLMIFSGNAIPQLSSKVAGLLGLPLAKSKIGKFSDGETQVSIEENVRGKDVFIIQSTCPPTNDNLMELVLMVDALRRASAARVTAVIPYFGYARQDRRVRSSRVSISARVIADQLATVGVDRVLTVDIHAEQIQGFFQIPVDNIYGTPILLDYINKNIKDDMVVVSPDIGGVVRARAMAKRLGCDLAIIDKRRPKANVSEVMNIIGDVSGRHAIIADDMVDTGGTLCKAAKALKDKGAAKVSAFCVHPVLSGNALQNISESVLEQLVVLDSIPLSDEAKKIGKIKQLSLASMLSEAIRRINNEESISLMFADLLYI